MCFLVLVMYVTLPQINGKVTGRLLFTGHYPDSPLAINLRRVMYFPYVVTQDNIKVVVRTVSTLAYP